MPFAQELIARLETTGFARRLRLLIVIVAGLLVFVAYNLRAYHNLNTLEAMDTAQVARNVSEGKGFSTKFVRPLSIYLVKKHNRSTQGDPAQLKTNHPDLANPPVYPLVLAGLMKVLPFRYPVDMTHAFWSITAPKAPTGRVAYRYEPDFLIALFNEVLLVGLVVSVFFLAKKLFDAGVKGSVLEIGHCRLTGPA